MPAITDPQRPQYHFLPAANWLNDPNGLIQWRGQYHLFYQYNPDGPLHGNIHWGHAVSSDLVYWTHLPIALAPTPGSPDEEGCWSGCAIDDNGVPTLIYTGVSGGAQRPCLARGSADLLTWEKWPGNPIIAGPPPGLDVLGFRDHVVWKEGDWWYQAIGSGTSDAAGLVLLYRATDLRQWEYLHPLYRAEPSQAPPEWAGSMWECPDFFPLGARHVLCISLLPPTGIPYTIYLTGSYADHTFTPADHHRLDYGSSFYAAQSLRDAQGRRIMWGWLREQRSDQAQPAAGWSGVMSLPRVLTLRDDGTLRIEPAPELHALRGAHQAWADVDLAGTLDLGLDRGGDSLEIQAELALDAAAEVGFDVRCSPDGEETTRISYHRATRMLVVDSSRASLSDQATGEIASAPLDLGAAETLKLHIFVDHSVVEVFANEHISIASRIYPTRADSRGVHVFAVGAGARVVALDAWDIIGPGE